MDLTYRTVTVGTALAIGVFMSWIPRENWIARKKKNVSRNRSLSIASNCTNNSLHGDQSKRERMGSMDRATRSSHGIEYPPEEFTSDATSETSRTQDLKRMKIEINSANESTMNGGLVRNRSSSKPVASSILDRIRSGSLSASSITASHPVEFSSISTSDNPIEQPSHDDHVHDHDHDHDQ